MILHGYMLCACGDYTMEQTLAVDVWENHTYDDFDLSNTVTVDIWMVLKSLKVPLSSPSEDSNPESSVCFISEGANQIAVGRHLLLTQHRSNSAALICSHST